jgi:hypothetical protein
MNEVRLPDVNSLYRVGLIFVVWGARGNSATSRSFERLRSARRKHLLHTACNCTGVKFQQSLQAS